MGLSIIEGVGNGGESPRRRTGRRKISRVGGTEDHGRQWEGRNRGPVGIPIAGWGGAFENRDVQYLILNCASVV